VRRVAARVLIIPGESTFWGVLCGVMISYRKEHAVKMWIMLFYRTWDHVT
jgi:hypothetical protein